jgi:hypothetical protein
LEQEIIKAIDAQARRPVVATKEVWGEMGDSGVFPITFQKGRNTIYHLTMLDSELKEKSQG